MRKILTIVMLMVTVAVSAQTVKRLRVYQQGGAVDTLTMTNGSTIAHSRLDLNGQQHSDYVSLIVTTNQLQHQYLIANLDSLVLPNGHTVVFRGRTADFPLLQEATGERPGAPFRTSFSGTFPGGSGVTYYWTENDHIRLDVGYESRAKNLTNSNTQADFLFEDADLDADAYTVYYPDKQVTILSHQTQTGANNTEHIGPSGDCGVATATRDDTPPLGGDGGGSYSFSLQHKAAYLCFLPHIDHLPSAKVTRIELYCSNPIAGTYELSETGLYNVQSGSHTIALDLVPQQESDFFIGHDKMAEQDSVAAYMVIAPQSQSYSFTATYYVTDTLSRISKTYRQQLSFQPVANRVYTITFNISDADFHAIDLGLSCNWSNVNAGADDPCKSGPAYASDAEANAALLEQTVVTEWLMPDEDQQQEILEKCTWTRGTYGGVSGYFVEGAAASLGDGIVHRIFIPCAEGRTKEQCLAENYRPVEALMIDLGLPSGTKWASRNIGANSVEGYGDYFAWGEVEPKESYSEATYQYGSQSLGNNYDISGTQNDAAVVNWGGLWRMPTKAEMLEMKESCNWTWSNINGVNGYIVTGISGNKIFLPSAGMIEGNNVIYSSNGGTYFTSTMEGDRSLYIWTLYWQHDGYDINVSSRENAYWRFNGTYERATRRHIGRTIRPVTSPNAITEDGNSYNIATDSVTWKLGDKIAWLHGTLSSSRPIAGEVTVGFVVGDSANIDIDHYRFLKQQTLSVGGMFKNDIDVHDNIGYWYRAYLKVGDTVYYGDARHYGYEFVDLGLPSGTLWANMNVGANKPSDSGRYYAWGEVEPKDSYTTDNYQYGSLNIGDDFDIAGTEYDAAHVNMGGAWQMPNKDQMKELWTECDWIWTTEDGINGYNVKSRTNQNSIFLPSTGLFDGSSLIYNEAGGTYYASTMKEDRSQYVWTLFWQKDGYNINVSFNEDAYWRFGGTYERATRRHIGRTVRAVFMPNAVTATNIINVRTDSTTWKLNDTEAVVYGTVSSTLPLAEGTKVGFVVGNSFAVEKASAVSVFTQSKTTTGSFHETIDGIENNIGYWYRAYVETPSGEVFYGDPKHFGWEMVDLGLPSGTLWANVNVGAGWPEESGNYYAWGEVEPKDSYTSSNYLYGTQNLGNNLNIAATEYDAAYVNMAKEWCMPTASQMQELWTQCDWEWTGHNGVNGYCVKSRTNANSIFLPSTGLVDGSSPIYNEVGGTYYTSTLAGNNSQYVWTLFWQKDGYNIKVSSNEDAYWRFGGTYERATRRYIGRTIRAVVRDDAAMVGD